MSTSDRTVCDQTKALYISHNDWLVGWLRQRVGCVETAADLAQDTFVRLLNKPRPVKYVKQGDTRARAYLGTIARGLCIDHWRRRDVEQAWLEALAANPEAVEPSPEQRLLVIEALLAFNAMLRQLPQQVADAFIMSQVEGLTYKEIATQLKVSERTVKKYMARAVLHCALTMSAPASQTQAMQGGSDD